jgi:hypothetical protein
MSQLGDAYSFACQFDLALNQYDKIIEIDPTFRRAFEGKGYVYIAKKGLSKGNRKFTRVSSFSREFR